MCEHRGKRLTDPYEPPPIAKNWVKCALVATLLALGGCAGPEFVENPESGIELRWPNGSDSLKEAEVMAETRCPPGRAQLDGLFTDRDETLARFYCR